VLSAADEDIPLQPDPQGPRLKIVAEMGGPQFALEPLKQCATPEQALGAVAGQV